MKFWLKKSYLFIILDPNLERHDTNQPSYLWPKGKKNMFFCPNCFLWKSVEILLNIKLISGRELLTPVKGCVVCLQCISCKFNIFFLFSDLKDHAAASRVWGTSKIFTFSLKKLLFSLKKWSFVSSLLNYYK